MGLDIALKVSDPSGNAVVEADRPNGEFGPEALSIVADRSRIDAERMEFEALCLDAAGGVYDFPGEKQKVLDLFRRSLQLRPGIGDQDGEAQTHTGSVYDDLDEKQQALDYYRKSLGCRAFRPQVQNAGQVQSAKGERGRIWRL